MKLKQLPQDFLVEEITDVAAGHEGSFVLYRLEKEGWSTPDALNAIRRRWRIDWRRIAYGGLKDRHARTVQYFTIFHGPERNLVHQRIKVTCLGRTAKAYSSRDIQANRFVVTLRDLDAEQLNGIETALAEVTRDGIANYFDDQRFGSVSDNRFMAKVLVFGQFEEALQLALAAPYEHDRSPTKREKAILRTHWGDWQTCKAQLPRGHARSIVDYLFHHPGDFRGAVARLRPDLRGLYLSAYQSYLWNLMLARWLQENCRPEQLLRVHLRMGEVPMHRQLDLSQREQLELLQLPLPTARWKPAPEDGRLPLVRAILGKEGLELDQLRVKGFREMYFAKGERAALGRVAELQHEVAVDERHLGRQKLTLKFALRRGCYATLLVKRLTARESWEQ